jgi:hypothetical protein
MKVRINPETQMIQNNDKVSVSGFLLLLEQEISVTTLVIHKEGDRLTGYIIDTKNNKYGVHTENEIISVNPIY